MNVSGNTIFIPGATSGIGLALALRLQKSGNTVVIGGRRTELLAQLESEHGFGTVRIDVADPVSIVEASAEVIATYPKVNVLVTMAGIMNAEDWNHPGEVVASAERIMTTNVLGTIRLIAAFTEHFIALPDATVMTVSSGLAFAPLAHTPSYNASKAAIHMLSESIRLQWAGTGIQVIELVPPAVQTDLMPGHAEDPHALPLEDFADEVLQILKADPDAREIHVERVKFLRYGEARGDYDSVVAILNGAGE